MAKTSEIRTSDKGFVMYVDGAYRGSFKSRAKAELLAALLTGAAKIDLRSSMLVSETREEQRIFDRQ